jgi:hypothetical protein
VRTTLLDPSGRSTVRVVEVPPGVSTRVVVRTLPFGISCCVVVTWAMAALPIVSDNAAIAASTMFFISKAPAGNRHRHNRSPAGKFPARARHPSLPCRCERSSVDRVDASGAAC